MSSLIHQPSHLGMRERDARSMYVVCVICMFFFVCVLLCVCLEESEFVGFLEGGGEE